MSTHKQTIYILILLSASCLFYSCCRKCDKSEAIISDIDYTMTPITKEQIFDYFPYSYGDTLYFLDNYATNNETFYISSIQNPQINNPFIIQHDDPSDLDIYYRPESSSYKVIARSSTNNSTSIFTFHFNLERGYSSKINGRFYEEAQPLNSLVLQIFIYPFGVNTTNAQMGYYSLKLNTTNFDSILTVMPQIIDFTNNVGDTIGQIIKGKGLVWYSDIDKNIWFKQ